MIYYVICYDISRDFVWYITLPCMIKHVILYKTLRDLVWYITWPCMMYHVTLYDISRIMIDLVLYIPFPCRIYHVTLYDISRDPVWYITWPKAIYQVLFYLDCAGQFTWFNFYLSNLCSPAIKPGITLLYLPKSWSGTSIKPDFSVALK